MTGVDLSSIAWPADRLGEAIHVLARRSGLHPRQVHPPSPPAKLGLKDVGQWIESTARYLGLETKPIQCLYPELEKLLLRSAPALVRLPGDGESRFLLLLGSSRRKVVLLGSDLATHRIGLIVCHRMLCEGREQPVRAHVQDLLDRAGISKTKIGKASAAMVSERLSQTSIGDCWLLRLPPGARFSTLVRLARVPHHLAVFSGLFTLAYLMWIFSWWVIGRGALEGRLDWGWLIGWALILLSITPVQMFANWYRGLLVVSVGGLLKQRLLQGALRLSPDEIRHQGAGHHLGRVIESEAVERLALSGGFLTLVAGIELLVAILILPTGAGGIPHSLLLVGWLGLALLIAHRYYMKRRDWTELRLGISHDLIEKMVGHRTRLAQQKPERWHEDEDEALSGFLDLSRAMDRAGVVMDGVPRGWMIVGVAGLAPAFISAQAELGRLAIGVGGVILAYRSLQKLVDGLTSLTDAAIAWRKVSALFHAAARETFPGDPAVCAALPSDRPASATRQTVLDASDLVYRYPHRSEPVLSGCSFRIETGDRVLLESPSGGGKSTLVALMNGLRSPDSGLLLLHGLDRRSLGDDGWARRIASAPQFHENHIITETFAFNLLMGRRWPPQPEDLEEAEALCRELGLGDLLDRMPGGMLQMVGDTGWQLSHGEKSRLYVARALLQNAELVALDESFGALDPDNLRLALGCALKHAPSLLVIAHP